MAKIQREQVVEAALALLDETGLDALSTRRLAQKLGVESAALYWHFRDKSALLAEMAAAVLTRHHVLGIPADAEQWPSWFADNARSFRRALLAYRDGARLHAGTTPGPDAFELIVPKLAYLQRAGFTKRDAGMALFAVSQFTIGCVLEEQAQAVDADGRASSSKDDALPRLQRNTDDAPLEAIDPERAFEFGLGLMVDGLRHRLRT